MKASSNWFQKVSSSLPEPLRTATLLSECDYYGASRLVSEKLKLDHVPASRAMWSHGWHYFPCEHHEVYKWAWHGQDLRLLVHREEEEHFLRGCGFEAIAVGAPFLYVDPIRRKKIPESLLIVPFHTVDYYPEHDYDEEGYFLTLDPFLRKFEHVAACIHPSCARKGIWLRPLQRRSIPWTIGAEADDSNALRRIRGLFERFSHVTSNMDRLSHPLCGVLRLLSLHLRATAGS